MQPCVGIEPLNGSYKIMSAVVGHSQPQIACRSDTTGQMHCRIILMLLPQFKIQVSFSVNACLQQFVTGYPPWIRCFKVHLRWSTGSRTTKKRHSLYIISHTLDIERKIYSRLTMMWREVLYLLQRHWKKPKGEIRRRTSTCTIYTSNCMLFFFIQPASRET